jgi:MFS family permease
VASIAARLNRLRPTAVHRHATIIAGIGSFFDLFDIFLAGVLASVLTQQFQLTRATLPLIIGSSFVGMFIGATRSAGTPTSPAAARFLRQPRHLLGVHAAGAFSRT